MTVIHAAPMPLPQVGMKRLGDARYPGVPYYASYGSYLIQAGLGRARRLGNAQAPFYGATRLGDARYPGVPYYASYGAYLIQAGLGRYARMQAQPSPARRMRGYARLGCCGGYPKRLGQNWWDDLKSLFTPVPGGGSVTVGGQTTYVDASGNPSAVYDPAAGSSNPLTIAANDASGLASAAASSIGSALPWWGWALIIGGGGLLVYRGFK